MKTRLNKILTILKIKPLIAKPYIFFKKIYIYTNVSNINRLIYHLKKGNISLIKERLSQIFNFQNSNLKLDLITNCDFKEQIDFSKCNNPKVSIVIPVYNQWQYTYKCLKSILLHTENIEYEIIVADDVSSDETISMKDIIKNITVVRNEKNLGFLLNCNNAAKVAKGDYILFLNNDTQVQKDWLSSLIELIESDEKIGMVGSKLVYPDGRLQEAGGIIWNDASGWNYGKFDDPTKPEYNYVKEVDYISGASIMIRKNLWKFIGGFDERYVPAYFEDSDLAFEVRKNGFKVMYQPKSVVVHFEGISHGTDTGTGTKAYQVKNREKFIEKWRDELEKNHFPNAENVFLARDRSSNKKHILIIDHYVPQFDQDAGSRTVFAYIKLFLKNDYKVTFIGDNFYKNEPYSLILEQMGVEILYGNYYFNNYKLWLKNNLKYIDYALVNRPHIAEKYIDILKSENTKIIFYGHDLHFLRDFREYNLTKDIDRLKSSNEWKEKELEIIEKAHISLYPSHVEVDEIKKINDKLEVEAIPAYLFEKFDNIRKDLSKTSDIMFVGGFSHTPNIDAILWFVNNIWENVKKQLPEIKLYIIGSRPNSTILSLQAEDIIVTGFVSDDKLKEYYQKTRIAIVPLRYGAGIKGKVVEAFYEQIPIITTSIGAEGLEEANRYMIIEDDEKEFANKLVALYEDIEKLNEFSNKGKIYCEKYFSHNKAKEVLSNIFDFKVIDNV